MGTGLMNVVNKTEMPPDTKYTEIMVIGHHNTKLKQFLLFANFFSTNTF